MGSNFTLETDRKDVLPQPGKKYFLMNSICIAVYGSEEINFFIYVAIQKRLHCPNNLQFFCLLYWMLRFVRRI